MAKLFIEIDDALLSKALINAQEHDVSLDIFISEAINAALETPTPAATRRLVSVNDLINCVVEIARTKEIGAEFMLFDICAKEDWDALGGGERKSLGKGFRKAVEGMSPPIAAYVRRTSSNKAVYQRV